jgi:hypothetical protein
MPDGNRCRTCLDATRARPARESIRAVWIAALPDAAPRIRVACRAQVVLNRRQGATIVDPARPRRSDHRPSQGLPHAVSLARKRNNRAPVRSPGQPHNQDLIAVRRLSRDRSQAGKAEPKLPLVEPRGLHRIPAEEPVAKVAEIESRNLTRKKSEDTP